MEPLIMFDTIFLIVGFSIIIGSCFGSFANMMIYRLCSTQSLFTARSMCPACKQILDLLDLIPIISYLRLGGRCKSCSQIIAKRYLIVELITPILFFFFLYPSSFMYLNLHYLVFGYIMLILFFTDLESFLLPLPLTGFLVILGFITSFFADRLLDNLISTAIIAIGFLLFRYIFNLIYKQDTFGLGDIILLSAITFNFGWQICISTFYCAVILGGFYSILLILLKKRSRKDLIPFGPFIIIGFLCSFQFLTMAVPFLFVN